MPLVSRLSPRAESHRPRLPAEHRQRLVDTFCDDIHLLGDLTGSDFSDWLSPTSRGSFLERTSG